MGKKQILLIFWTVHDISRSFDYLTPYNSHCDPFGGFFFFFYRFSRQFMKFTGLLKFWPPTPPPEPPGVGWVKKTNFIDFLDSSWNWPDFWNFDPQPPGTPRGGMGKKNKFYRFSGQFMTFPGVLIFWPPKIRGGRSIFLGRNHPQICRDLCKSASMIPSHTKFKVWGVTLLTRWGQYCLGRNVRHCGKVSKCEFSSFWAIHLYHGGWV